MVDLNTGIISNYAASTALGAGYSGDGGPATNAQICTPEGLFCDPAGNLLICDADNNRVRKVAAGTMSTFAGQNALFGEGFPATNAEICLPANMNCDAAGNVYIADYQNNRVRKYSPSTGLLTTVAGSGIGGYDDGYSGDGGPATAANMYNPYGVAVDGAGNIYVADLNNARIRKVNTSGIITTIAGTGVSGYSGNHSAATGAELGGPAGLALDNAGNLYMADVYNNCIRKIDNAGIITTVAGNTFAGYASDNVAATATPLNTPLDVAVDANNNLYIADNGNNRIRKVDTAGIITTVAGGNTAGYSGDNGPATAAQLRGPNSIKTDAYGDIFFTDGGNQCVRMINAAGYISTIAGTTATGFSGDGGPAIAASFNGADGLAVDNAGNVYIADGNNYRVRKVQLPNLSVPVVSNLNRVAAFPNPTNGPVNIINAQGCDYLLYDEAGRQVLGGRVQSARETFDLKGRASGLYTLQVSNTLGDKKTIRIILE